MVTQLTTLSNIRQCNEDRLLSILCQLGLVHAASKHSVTTMKCLVILRCKILTWSFAKLAASWLASPNVIDGARGCTCSETATRHLTYTKVYWHHMVHISLSTILPREFNRPPYSKLERDGHRKRAWFHSKPFRYQTSDKLGQQSPNQHFCLSMEFW